MRTVRFIKPCEQSSLGLAAGGAIPSFPSRALLSRITERDCPLFSANLFRSGPAAFGQMRTAAWRPFQPLAPHRSGPDADLAAFDKPNRAHALGMIETLSAEKAALADSAAAAARHQGVGGLDGSDHFEVRPLRRPARKFPQSRHKRWP